MEHTKQADGEEHDRQHVDSVVPMRDLIDSYMKPFQACVEQGEVTGLMCSYNSVNGVPSCGKTLPLPCVSNAFVAETVPFLADFQRTTGC